VRTTPSPAEVPDAPVHRFGRGRILLEIAGGTVTGNRYPANFDVLHLDPELPLAVLADGMGAGEGSRIAGRTAVDTLVEAVRAPGRLDPARLRAAVAEVQSRVLAAGEHLPGLAGCTLTALLVVPDGETAWLVHLGDSRAYRLRQGLLEQLTVDHTMAWLGVLNGWYPADSAQAGRDRYHLTRYVGHPDRPEADLLAVSPRSGDRYLLCTDGIADQVGYHRLATVLERRDPAAAVRELLADSLGAGGRDNATAVVLHVRPHPG
jgi:serine/threonine protein phosphatase PrpC